MGWTVRGFALTFAVAMVAAGCGSAGTGDPNAVKVDQATTSYGGLSGSPGSPAINGGVGAPGIGGNVGSPGIGGGVGSPAIQGGTGSPGVGPGTSAGSGSAQPPEQQGSCEDDIANLESSMGESISADCESCLLGSCCPQILDCFSSSNSNNDCTPAEQCFAGPCGSACGSSSTGGDDASTVITTDNDSGEDGGVCAGQGNACATTTDCCGGFTCGGGFCE